MITKITNKDVLPASKSQKVSLNFKILGTGSSGNCIILNDEIAFDCGVSKFKNYFNRLDRLKLKTILISHAHNDHCNGINTTISQDFLNLSSIVFPTSYITNQENIKDENASYIKKLPVHLKNSTPTNCVILASFDVAHDVPNNGYIIYYKGKLIVYATDVGDIEKVLVGYNIKVCNEDVVYEFYTMNDIRNKQEENEGQQQASHNNFEIDDEFAIVTSPTTTITAQASNSSFSYLPFDFYIIECNHDKKVLLENATSNSKRNNYYIRSLNVHLSTINCNRYLQFLQNVPCLLVHRSIENLPINKQSYFFLTNFPNVRIAINPFETIKLKDKMEEFRLTTNWKIEV